MSERYVYIDAPTLDNSDQSKFAVNEDFKFVSTSASDDAARFPLYEKFLTPAWRSSIDSEGLIRKEFKTGVWGLKNESDGDGDDNINNGGDYIMGNTSQIHISNFIVGKLAKLRFRIYNEDKITIENRGTEEHPTEITSYSTVPKVYILETQVEEDKVVDKYKVVAIANWEGNNIYTVDRDYYITGDKLKTNNFSLVFVFVPARSGKCY